jgi:hypothetical protein
VAFQETARRGLRLGKKEGARHGSDATNAPTALLDVLSHGSVTKNPQRP